MINLLIVDGNEGERSFLEKSAHRQILRLTDDDCSYNVFSDCDNAAKAIEKLDQLDIAIIDVTTSGGRNTAELVRKKYSSAMLLMIEERTAAPESYVVPELSPNVLLLRPADASRAEHTMRCCFDWFYNNIYQCSAANCFSFKSKDGRTVIDYSNISYFESREKRIILSTDNKEYYFYETIDNLAQTLPEMFLRCHRSFIVNVNKIRNVRLADNCIFLENGFIVPVSRSYKAELKGKFKNA